jgi:hypothetical protein
MSRPVGTFKQGDIERAIRGAAKAGQRPSRVEIDRAGTIVLVMGVEPAAPTTNPWDAKISELVAK